LYGREAILPGELGKVRYECDVSYDDAVCGHILKMWEMHEKALERNRGAQEKMKVYRDLKKVKHHGLTEYKEDDLVWFDLSRLMRTKKAGMRR